jgi:hypothetical protein
VRKLIVALLAVSVAASLAAIAVVPAGARRVSGVSGAARVSGARRAAGARPCRVPGVGKPLDRVWKPDMGAAFRYAQTRAGDITFAVRTLGSFYGYRPYHQEWSASILKAMLMVAYLDMPSVAGRALNGSDTGLLDPMITMSDNNAADTVFTIVGTGGLNALAARAAMHDFAPTGPIWGESLITAANQTWFFLHLDSYVVPRHRAYALHLLTSITASQRWGIGEVAPQGWKLYFKGGWGSGTGLIDSQVALLSRGCSRFSIAVLTMHDPSHEYGKETLAGVFSRLLRGLPEGRHRRYR